MDVKVIYSTTRSHNKVLLLCRLGRGSGLCGLLGYGGLLCTFSSWLLHGLIGGCLLRSCFLGRGLQLLESCLHQLVETLLRLVQFEAVEVVQLLFLFKGRKKGRN